MANYKVVDADELDAGLKTIADSIREKTGGTEELSFPTGMKEAVDAMNNASGDAVDIVLQSKVVEPEEIVKVVTPDKECDALSAVTVNAIPNKYIGSGVPRKAAATYTPTKDIQIIDAGQYLEGKQTIDPIPSNYIDTSGATAGAYDIYNGMTAWVNGELVTGAYDYQGHGGDSQWSAGSSGCSETALVIPVPFTPKGCCVCLNSETYNSNTIVSADFMLGNVATYHTYKGTLSGMTRSQYTSGISSYISYSESTKKLTIKSPSSSYKWSTANYRVLIFR